jgi:putative transposase
MQLNELGQLAEKYWLEIPIHFPFIELGNFVIMPNHTHGILIIDKPVQTLQYNISTKFVQTLHCNVCTSKNEQMAKISPKSGTISTIIRSYKSVVSKNARLIFEEFAWQSRFHDHIIRDAQSFERIQNYIANNPENWNEDKFYK